MRRGPSIRKKIYDAVDAERRRQIARWGAGHDEKYHSEPDDTTFTFLIRQRADYVDRFGKDIGVRKKLIQIMALACAKIEIIDRRLKKA